MDAIERYARALERRMGGVGPPTRDQSVAALCARLSLTRATMDLRHGLRRGRCRKRGCDSRYAVVRVTIDTRDPERVDRSAALECALCGHTWRSCAMPDLRLRNGGLPRVLLTLILPPRRGESRRVWYNRAGNPVWSGADAQTVREATYTQLSEAIADHDRRAERSAAKREATRVRNAELLAAEEAERRVRMAAIDARLAAAGSPLA